MPESGAPSPWSERFAPLRTPPPDTESALRFCHNLAARHYENFPVFLRLFAKEQQNALAAVYAFSRLADDFADEPEFRPYARDLLQAWENQLHETFEGRARHPVFIALGRAVRRFPIEKNLLLDLLDAFRQDGKRNHYETFDEVLDYCRRSADPVGRIVLAVLGETDEENRVLSDRICTALQLTNFWQDLSVDIPRGRHYIPDEDLARFGLRREDLQSGPLRDAHRELIRLETERTRVLFREGQAILRRTGYPARLYLAGVLLGGRTVLRMVKDLGPDVLRTRPKLGKRGVAEAWLRAGMDRVSNPMETLPWMH